MGSWIAISRTNHAAKHWRQREGFEFAATYQVIPILLAELAKVLPHYVLGFTQTQDGAYQLVALVGVGGERNLYVSQQSQWLCKYVPAELRGYPFASLSGPDGSKVVCIDDAFLSDEVEDPWLFNREGELNERVAETLRFITQREQNKVATAQAVAALATAGVIEPWPIEILRSGDKTPLKINGMHRVSESALNKLAAETLAALRGSGALALAYAQLFANEQMHHLTERAEFLVKEQSDVPPLDGLSDLFGTEDAGSLNFDAFEASNDDTENK